MYEIIYNHEIIDRATNTKEACEMVKEYAGDNREPNQCNVFLP